MGITKRVIITGGPGTGKTTLLHQLQKKGYPCHSEISRAVIRQQLDLNTNLLPWDDLSGFSYLVSKGQVLQYKEAKKDHINFYDRGIPDVLAYLRKENIHEAELEEIARIYPYTNPVFLTPPWPEIYGQDDERREDLNAMIKIHEALKEVYESLGYEVKEIPKVSVEERLIYLFDHLGIEK